MARKIRFSAIFFTLAVLFTSTAALANVVYVKTTGSDTYSGSSWALAKKTVGAGVRAALYGDQVWVAKGTYLERITLQEGAAIYGGFVGTETSLSQRNWKTNVTILDGNDGGSVVSCPAGLTSSARIDGFTIRNGYASSGNLDGTSNGGGICSKQASPVIANNIITGNNADSFGGGIYCELSNATIINNLITKNTSGSDGGGIYCLKNSPTISNNTIAENTSNTDGGGIYCKLSSPKIINNTIARNTSTSDGGGLYCNDSAPAITNTIIASNTSGVYRYDTGTSIPSIKYSCVYGNSGYNFSGLTDPTGVDGNVSINPSFVNSLSGDYHIAINSLCINKGDNSVVTADAKDIDGQSRISASKVDIGSDESIAILPTITTQPVSKTASIGKSVTFSLTATNATTYQWRKSNVNIGGATKSSYTLSAITSSNVGSYNCKVSNSSGSVTSTTVSLAVNAAPTVGTVTSVIGTSPQQDWKIFTCTYNDPNGYANLATCYMPITPTINSYAGGTCAVYDQNENKFYLKNSNGTTTLGAKRSQDYIVQSDRAYLDCKRSTAVFSGNTITVKFYIKVTREMCGRNYGVYLNAKDDAGVNSGWVKKGTAAWTFTNQNPTLTSVSPASGSITHSTWNTFACIYTDNNGRADLGKVYMLINTSASYSKGVCAYYDANTNKLYMRNNAGSVIGGYAPGSVNTIETENAKLDCENTTIEPDTAVTSSVLGSLKLKVNFELMFKSTMAGKNCLTYLKAEDDLGGNSNWVSKGTLNILSDQFPPPPPPTTP